MRFELTQFDFADQTQNLFGSLSFLALDLLFSFEIVYVCNVAPCLVVFNLFQPQNTDCLYVGLPFVVVSLLFFSESHGKT